MTDSELKTAVGGGGPRVRPPQELLEARLNSMIEAFGSVHAGATYGQNLDAAASREHAQLLIDCRAQLADLRGERDRLQQHEADAKALSEGLAETLGFQPSSHEAQLIEHTLRAAVEVAVEALRCAGAALQQQLTLGAAKLRLNSAGMNPASVANWALWLETLAKEGEAVQHDYHDAHQDLTRLRSRGQALVQQIRQKWQTQQQQLLSEFHEGDGVIAEVLTDLDALTAALTDERTK